MSNGSGMKAENNNRSPRRTSHLYNNKQQFPANNGQMTIKMNGIGGSNHGS